MQKRIVAAEPHGACAPLENAKEAKGAIVVALRGNCTFGSKGVHVNDAGASSLILVNNEEGNQHVPGPDAHDLPMSVSMMARREGELVLKSLSQGQSLTGAMVPIHCNAESKIRSGELCQAATTDDRAVVSGLAHGGWISAGEATIGEFLIATFGLRVPTMPTEIVMADPPIFCTAPTDPTQFAGKAVVVHRGKCQFIEKAEAALAAGASMLIIVNTETSLSRFGVEPRWRGLAIDMPVVMVTDIAGEQLTVAAENGNAIKFTHSSSVSERDWGDIARFATGKAWTRNAEQDAVILSAALEKHAGWPEREAAIRGAYGGIHPSGMAG
jgi:hypothetical protein